MDVSSLSETQYAKLETAIMQAMVSAAAQTINSLNEIQKVANASPTTFSMADVLERAMPDMASTLLKYRPFEFNDFLTSLEG